MTTQRSQIRPEEAFFLALLELGYEPNKDFTYQPSERINDQGSVIHFMFTNPPNLAINIQGVYYQHDFGGDIKARDLITRETLVGQGITLIFVDEDDVHQDAVGIAEDALQFIDKSRLGGR